MKSYFSRIIRVVPPSEYAQIKVENHIKNHSVVFYFGYSEFTIRKGAFFNYLSIESNRYKVNGTLTYITQEFSLPWDEIPLGWRTACVVDFRDFFDYIKPIPVSQSSFNSENEMLLGYDESFT